MDIKTKCEIIEEFIRDHVGEGKITDIEVINFIEYHNVGIPIAQAVTYDLVELKEEGKAVVEETWEGFCELLEIDKDGEYTSIEDCFGEEL